MDLPARATLGKAIELAPSLLAVAALEASRLGKQPPEANVSVLRKNLAAAPLPCGEVRMTHRWREWDSNSWSHPERNGNWRAPAPTSIIL